MLLVFAQSGALGQKVTLTVPATAVPAAVARLAAESHVALYADASEKTEMVVLRFKDVSLQTAMDKIAEVTSAAWVKTDQGYKLVRTPEIVQRLKKQELTERTAKLEKILDSRIKNLFTFNEGTAALLVDLMKPPPPPSLDAGADQSVGSLPGGPAPDGLQRIEKARLQQPGARLALRLAKLIGADTLAGLGNRRTVFSTSPTKMQRPLPPGAMDIVAKGIRDQKIWHKVAGKPDDDPSEAIRFTTNDLMPTMEAQDVEGIPANVVCVVQPEMGGEELYIRCVILDQKGKDIWSATAPIGEHQYPWTYPIPAGESSEAQPAPFSLTPAAQAVIKLYENSTDVIANQKAPKEIEPYLLHPETNEPMTLFPSEPLLQLLCVGDRNVAASVDDTLFGASLDWDRSTDLKKTLTDYDVSSDESWLTIRPHSPLDAEHAARAAVGRFFRSAMKEGHVSLDTLGDYAASEVVPAQSLIQSFGTRGLESLLQWWDFLRLYGSIDPSIRMNLCGGGSLRVRSMPPSAQQALQDIVYNSYGDRIGFDYEALGSVDWTTFPFSSLEPTAFLANGLDPDISLHIEPEMTPLLFVSRKQPDGSVNVQQEELGEVAAELLDAQKPKSKEDPEERQAPPIGYCPGYRRTLHCSLSFPGKQLISEDLFDVGGGLGPLVQLDQLPPDIQDSLRRQMEEMKKELDGGDPPPRT